MLYKRSVIKQYSNRFLTNQQTERPKVGAALFYEYAPAFLFSRFDIEVIFGGVPRMRGGGTPTDVHPKHFFIWFCKFRKARSAETFFIKWIMTNCSKYVHALREMTAHLTRQTLSALSIHINVCVFILLFAYSCY